MTARPATFWKRIAPDRISAAALMLAVILIGLVAPPVIQWMALDATFPGGNDARCDNRGACWLFVAERMPQFLYGYYPAPERWRLHLIAALVAVWCALEARRDHSRGQLAFPCSAGARGF